MAADTTCRSRTRANRRGLRRAVLEPWLLGLAGFTFTATAMLLVMQEGPLDRRVAALAQQVSTTVAN